MTKEEAMHAKVLINLAVPFHLPADALAFYAARPLGQGIGDVALAAWLATRETAKGGTR